MLKNNLNYELLTVHQKLIVHALRRLGQTIMLDTIKKCYKLQDANLAINPSTLKSLSNRGFIIPFTTKDKQYCFKLVPDVNWGKFA